MGVCSLRAARRGTSTGSPVCGTTVRSGTRAGAQTTRHEAAGSPAGTSAHALPRFHLRVAFPVARGQHSCSQPRTRHKPVTPAYRMSDSRVLSTRSAAPRGTLVTSTVPPSAPLRPALNLPSVRLHIFKTVRTFLLPPVVLGTKPANNPMSAQRPAHSQCGLPSALSAATALPSRPLAAYGSVTGRRADCCHCWGRAVTQGPGGQRPLMAAAVRSLIFSEKRLRLQIAIDTNSIR